MFSARFFAALALIGLAAGVYAAPVPDLTVDLLEREPQGTGCGGRCGHYWKN
ncbi:hypothetical protein BV25DRAFT_1920160 [Artomyces pyxidatus]|uniref:Uncharacterized protein n=1 Tax=Artomyces pyxidatus TaxID=48021 RepID=A0ACB8SMF4_9AGAM|nr:hypothetical protein BV25DRAFT_1920160 [Artomyces pyxidatus]